MKVLRGHRMSVAMTNCGALGWVSDRNGYRYDASDPDSGKPWPLEAGHHPLLGNQRINLTFRKAS